MNDYQFNPNAEQWKDIPGFPGYQVSDHGRVRSFWKLGNNRNNSPNTISQEPQRIIKANPHSNTYPSVGLSNNKIKYIHRIHLLVLNVFNGPCPPGMEACHNDGNKHNNYLNNLRWDTHINNLLDTIKHGTNIRHNPKGILNGRAKLTEKQVILIRQMAEQGTRGLHLSSIFGVHSTTIYNIIHRRLWNHL
jgi:hypothetical protein